MIRGSFISLLVLTAALIEAEQAVADAKCREEQSAKLVSLQGKVFFDDSGHGQWRQAALDERICQGGRVRIEPYSRASLSLPNGIILRLDEGAVLSLNGIARDETNALDLLKGFIHFISRTPKHLEITTPIANAGPEGTEFAMQVDDDKAALWVYEGSVRFFNRQGDIRLNPGQGAQSLRGQAPQARIDVKPEDAVNWALYYPPILPTPPVSPAGDDAIQTALQDYRRGRIDDALARLDAMPVERQTPYFFKARAALSLTAGRVPQAEADIHRVTTENPRDAEALALQSIIALTQNRKDEALRLAQHAASTSPTSSAAYSALSYAEQSRFDLDRALSAAQHAAELSPNDAMAWARVAELHLARGETSDSETAARRALSLDAELERTQTVAGFSRLLQMEAEDAKEAFLRALKLDSSSPLARLGLGLAKIRLGDLSAGRRDLEIAAVLDPNNAMIRSYLGKAYYEEKRSPLAQDQFELAKQRDPKDPTAYFYDAIHKQSVNRPVEALHEVQRAVDLNGNRAVYRSSLALDKDLAARSAAQGRIFNDLGFQRLGLLQGWKSVNDDPSNYSAHRLLADTYASQPQHEIARVSELLQSQLLQPLNITPIQPQLTQGNLLIVDGLGPSSLSFNEFNPLFARNRFALQSSGIYGSNNTWGEDVTHSGLWDKGSYSVGQFHYNTDGFRDNNFIKQNLYHAFVQGQVSDSLNLQAAFQHEDRKNGDLSINFDPNNFSRNFKQQRDIETYRAGGSYKMSPQSLLLGSLIYQDVDISLQRQFSVFIPVIQQSISLTAGQQLRRKGYIGELQHQYQSERFSLISGAGYLDQSVNQIDLLGLVASPRANVSNPDISRANLYSYLHLKSIDRLIATLGFSYDRLKIDGTFDRNPLNPKLGVVFNPTPSTTFRAALFRASSITRASNQTIEPTQVAGFNQLFDDINGTSAWRYGGGLDHKFSSSLFAGLEYSERQLDVPIGIGSADWKERLSRAYVYATPNDLWSLGVEYFYEKIDRRENPNNTGIVDVETHRAPVTLSVFHPSGFSGALKASYISQHGLFESVDALGGSHPFNGSSDFFVFDLDLHYRLPARHGIVSLGIKNLFDNRSRFQANNSFIGSNSNEIPFAPERIFFTRIQLAL